jgi:putative SOS response-associated peptidase YedK
MCFYSQQKDPIKKVKKRFNAEVNKPELFLQDNYINGFSHPNIPVILDKNPNLIETDYHWGLLPSWTNEIEFRKNTLNARIETISEKPSFKNYLDNRCLIIATAFYEWHWLDEKGKKKQKYQINSNDEIFTFAGIYNHWTNPATGEIIKTYAMLTTQANATMQYIHNHKKRMPIILQQKDELDWLNSKSNINDFAFPYEANLIGFPVE